MAGVMAVVPQKLKSRNPNTSTTGARVMMNALKVKCLRFSLDSDTSSSGMIMPNPAATRQPKIPNEMRLIRHPKW